MAGITLDELTDIQIIDSGGHELDVQADGSLNVNLSSTVDDDEPHTENSVPVGGRGVSGLLTALSASNDKYDLLGDLYRRTWVNSSANIAIKATAVTVGTTEVNLAATGLAGRRFITIQNEGTADIFIGATGVLTSTGVKISKKSSATYELAEDIDVFAISGTAGQDVRVFEAA